MTRLEGMPAGQGSAAAAGPGDLSDDLSTLRSRVDLSGLPPLSRVVTERIILATADLGYAADLVCLEPALEAGVAALAGGAPVVADSPMAAAGVESAHAALPGADGSAPPTLICKAGEPLSLRLARTVGIGPAAAAVRLAFGAAGPSAVWVVGSEPGAIAEILARGVEPALVIGTPAGLTAAQDAKRALRMSGVPALTNISPRGGPVVAVAACAALMAMALPARGSAARNRGR